MGTEISVVIPVYNKSELTQRCLESLLKHSSSVGEVTVVDNASSDSTGAFLKDFRARFEAQKIKFTVFTNQKNVGFGRACNQGIRISQGEFVVILNNDTWLMPNWDRALRDTLLKGGFAVVGPYFYERDFSENLSEVAADFISKNKNSLRHHFVPILMFFRRSAIEALRFDHGGIFDERFFVTYEDTDLKHRMKLKNLRWAQTGSCFIWHHSMGTRSDPNLLPSGYEAEGLRLFIEKWGFDPRLAEHTVFEKLKRRWWKFCEKRGKF